MKNNNYEKPKKNNKNKTNTKNNIKTKDYSSVDNVFDVTVNLGNGIIQNFSFDLKKDDLHYDNVIDKACEIMDEKFPEDVFPKAEISKIEIFCNEIKEKCPVFAESEKEKIENVKKDNKYSRYLVLPEYTYQLTPECKLWMTLKEKGILKDEDAFDAEKMKEILESVKNM